MTSKKKYREHCSQEKGIPIFSTAWWLDAVCGEDHWDVVLAERNGQIVASLPYYSKRAYGFNLITMPKLTQTMGVWIKYRDNMEYSARLSYEKEIFSELIDQLPPHDVFIQNFNYSITNWLPFYWKGYRGTTNYTYVIEDIRDPEKVRAGFSHAKIKNIKRAESIVQVKYDLSAEMFYENHKMTLAKQNRRISYSFNLFKDIYDAAHRHSAAKTIYAINSRGDLHSAFFVIWDDESAYYLISTIDPAYRDSGSSSLLIKEIIKYLSTKTKSFNFEGSMLESVENSFRQFGAIQKPYFQISKVNSMAIKLLNSIKDICT